MTIKSIFTADKGLKQLVAYFLREEVAGIVLGADHATAVPRYR